MCHESQCNPQSSEVNDGVGLISILAHAATCFKTEGCTVIHGTYKSIHLRNIERETERERKREREKHTYRERKRDREKERERETHIQRERKRDR